MKHDTNGHDRAWLREIFEQYESRLVTYAAGLIGDVERGRDAAQDVFLKLCREGSPIADRNWPAWLYTVCRNRALDICRKERRVSSLPQGVIATTIVQGADPAELAAERESATRAVLLLGRLPKNQQEVIRLKIEHGLKYREISDITGLSVSNVGYLLHQGIQTLRRQIADGDE